jgi:sulfatase maturation enzyme AslB (radical SAM superfamily)
MISPTFCAAPWTVYCVNASGTAGICCVNSEHTVPVDQHEQLLHGSQLQDIKQKMLAGERIAGCEKCYKNESLGIASLRQMYNDYTGPALDPASLADPTYEARIWYDLSLSNLCNQKCRICGHYNSTAWHKDAMAMADLPWAHHNWHHLDDVLIENHGAIGAILARMSRAREDFWIELKGGEPLYLDTSLRLLQEMINRGLHERTRELRIMTNGTQINQQVMELLARFPAINMSISIDAVGKLHEYTRGTNMSWDQCRRSWQQLIKLPNISKFRVSNTIYAYTVLRVPELIDWVHSEFGKQTSMSHSMLHKPKYLRANLVPRHLRQLTVDRLINYPALAASLIIDPKSDDAEVAERRSQFKLYTQRLDQLRGESLLDLVPELAEMMA